MGEANLRFARGDADTAIKMCMEVIRQDPGAPEPFQTLSTLYDEVGELEKSVQFAVIGAHLAPPDAEEWERLANMSLELGDPRQAASCYKKAIGNAEISFKRSESHTFFFLSKEKILDCQSIQIHIMRVQYYRYIL